MAFEWYKPRTKKIKKIAKEPRFPKRNLTDEGDTTSYADVRRAMETQKPGPAPWDNCGCRVCRQDRKRRRERD